MNEELTAKEILQIIRKICEAHNTCNECQFGKLRSFDSLCGESCKVGMDNHADEVIEICKKWKADHRQIETEWAYICRIIEDFGNKKQCVYEAQIEADMPFADYDQYERGTEEILKQYCRNHEGNFFAVVERVCRKVVG